MSKVDDSFASSLGDDEGRSRTDADAGGADEHDVTDEVAAADLLAPPADADVEAGVGEPATDEGTPLSTLKSAPATDRPARPGPPKKTRTQKRREWRQVEKARRYAARKSVRFPIFTRSVLLWMLIFAMVGMAFGASGAFWWAHFNTQVAQLRDDTKDFEQREQGAAAAIDAQRNQALTQINAALDPISNVLNDTKTVKLGATFAPSVWFVSTQDDAGKPSAGSAFALVADGNEALMVTSFQVVRASALQPGPPLKVQKVTKDGNEEVDAELWATDEEHDLALLLVKRGNIPVLEWAGDEAQSSALGTRMYSATGYAGQGAALSPGMVIDSNASGFQYTASVGTSFRGGPIVGADGKVLGITSLDYHPGNWDPGDVHFSVSINTVCTKILSCGGGIKKKNAKAVEPPTGPAAATPGQPVPTTAAPTGRGPND